MGEVIESRIVTKLPIPVEKIIAKATAAELEEVVIIGMAKDGSFYFSSSEADGGTVLWLMEMAKRRLMAFTDTE